MSGGGGSNTNTVQNSDPWSGQQPYLRYGFEQAQQNLENPPQFYPGATYTPFSKQTEQAMQMAQNRAINGSPLESAMQGNLTSTLQGDFLNSNPYLDKTFQSASRAVSDQFTDTVMPSLNASFGGAGGSGSGIHREMGLDAADTLGRNLNELATNIYGGNYQSERDRMMQANAYAPAAAGLDWQNIGQLGKVGGMVEGKSKEILDDDINRFNYYQNLPDDALARYSALIQGNYGGSTQTMADVASNPLAGAAGGGLLGYGVGSQLSWLGGPWGALIGAGLGYALS